MDLLALPIKIFPTSPQTAYMHRQVRRVLPFALAAGLSIVILFALSQTGSWWQLKQSVYSGRIDGSSEEPAQNGKHIEPDPRGGELDAVDLDSWKGSGDHFIEPKVDSMSPYPIGKTKPAGSNYTRCLVVPKINGDDTSWIGAKLGDMVENGLLTTAIYEMDDPMAPLHPVKNKGNEAMAYLSYIIDFYDKLPDVAIFMHSHRYARHNNLILDKDALLMVRHLSPERVTREGYMNLRCHWEPGCPDWLHTDITEPVYEKPEQHHLANSWAELFPRDQIPTVLAQPCCGQFAVSRERILAIPKGKFIGLRDWIIRTDLSDYLSGRVFEFAWQYIFTSSSIHCPSMSACYCDGYGICFGDAKKFDYYFELNFNLNKLEEELQLWNEEAEVIALAHKQAKDGKMNGEELLEVPEFGKDLRLKEKIRKIREDMKRRAEAAFELGKDPRQRAKEAGRIWNEGDAF